MAVVLGAEARQPSGWHGRPAAGPRSGRPRQIKVASQTEQLGACSAQPAAARRSAPELYRGRRALQILRRPPPYRVTVREYCPST